MPTLPVSEDKVGVGAARGGKHWTKAEVEARRAEAESLSREKPARMYTPKWLDDDARRVWRATIRRLRGLELIDSLDTDLLALYCDAVSKYKRISAAEQLTDDDHKALQAWARLILSYADKLGLSPNGRARLAKRRAEQQVDQFAEAFDG